MAADKRPLIVSQLKLMRDVEKANKQPFKVAAYTKVIKSLEQLDKPLNTLEDLDAASIPGLGKGIKEKIVQIMENGKLEQVESIDMDKQNAISQFMQIMSVGPVKAKALVETHNIMSIEELRKKASELLNNKQQIGLKYYEDFNLRIPRKEMDKHYAFIEKHIKKVNPEIQFEMTGSYRRGLPTSGDIDVLITGGDKDSLSKIVE